MAKIRQEINIQNQTLTATAASVKVIQLDTTAYNDATYYFEAVWSNSDATFDGGVVLRRFGTSTDDATITCTKNTAAKTRTRVSFTPPAGQTQYITQSSSAGPSPTNPSITAARIIVIQNASSISATQTQIDIGNQETGKSNTANATFVNPKYWKYTQANWDGTINFYAEVLYISSSSKLGVTIILQEDDGAFGTWSDKVTVVSGGTSTTKVRVRSAAFTPTDGRNYRLVFRCDSSKSTYSIHGGQIIATQTGTITKLEPQYMLLNRQDLSTGLQTMFTLFDADEWSGVTNTYKHAHDATNASDSSKLTDVTSSTDVSSSTVTGANQQISSALSFTDDHEIDTNVINTTGNVTGSRILVAVSVDSATSGANVNTYISILGVG